MKEKNNSFSQNISKLNNSKMKLTNTESFTSINSSFSSIEKEDISSKMNNIIKKIEEYQIQNDGKAKEEEISFQIKKILLGINKKIYNILDEKNNSFLHILTEKSKLYPLKIICNTYYILLDNQNIFYKWFFLENSDKLTVLDIASIKGNKSILSYLYSVISKTNASKLNFEEQNNKKNTIFHYSAKNKKYFSILFWYEKLQKYFPNTKIFDLKNDKNLTPLHLACFHDSYECAQLLIDLGADLNAVDITGKSVLTYAINSNNIKIIELLLLNGADREKMDSDGKIPYDYSIKVCSKNIQLLLNKSYQINSVFNNKNCFEFTQLILMLLFFIFFILSRFLDVKDFKNKYNKYIYIGIIFLGISFLFAIITIIFMSYFFCCIKHKQHLKRKKPNLLNLYEKYNCDICIKCLKRKKEKTYHCALCNLCFENWKFHSYWLNTCITKEYLIKYKIFVFSLIILLFSNIISDIFFLSYAFLDKNEYKIENNLFNNFFYLYYNDDKESNKNIKNFIFIPFFSSIIAFLTILIILIIIKLFKNNKEEKNNFNFDNVHYHNLRIGLINDEDDKKDNDKSFSMEASIGD